MTTLQGHRFGDSVEALCFVDLANGTGDGGRGLVCVSGGTDGCGFVWDVATGRVRSEIQHDVRFFPLYLFCLELRVVIGGYNFSRSPSCSESTPSYNRVPRFHSQDMGYSNRYSGSYPSWSYGIGRWSGCRLLGRRYCGGS